MRFDLLNVFFIQLRQFRSRLTMRAQQFVYLRMNRLGIPMLCPAL
jgi:hypothetical protein